MRRLPSPASVVAIIDALKSHQPGSRTYQAKARIPLAEAARRLGYSVEMLVSTYLGAMDGDDTEANSLLDKLLGTTREQIVMRDRPAGSRAP